MLSDQNALFLMTNGTNASNCYLPFLNSTQFKIANFLFTKEQMSSGKIDEFMELWNEWNELTLPDGVGNVPFVSKNDLHSTIDSIIVGDVLWQSFSVVYEGDHLTSEVPSWMDKSFDVGFRCPQSILHNQLESTDFTKDMDYCPKRVFISRFTFINALGSSLVH